MSFSRSGKKKNKKSLKPAVKKVTISKNQLILGLICAILIVSHSLYVFKSYQYPEIDEHTYMDISVAFYRILKNDLFNAPGLMVQYLIDHPPFRQPLYQLVLSLVYLPFGISHSYTIALWLNVVFYTVTVVGIYFIGKEYLSKTASLMGSVIFSCFGFSLFYLHFTYSETFVTMWIVLTLVFLLKSNRFQSRRYSLLFGVSLFAALFSRWITFAFLAGPILYVLIQSFRTARKNRARVTIAKNLGIIALLLVPVAWFYLATLPSLQSYFSLQNKYAAAWIDAYKNNPYLKNSFSPQSIAYYFLVFAQNTVFFFFLFIAGLALAIKNFKKYALLLLAFFIPYAQLTFAAALKDDRYIVPIYPVIAVISAIFFEHVPIRFKKSLVVIIVVLSIGNFFGAVWGIGPMKKGLESILLPMPVGHPRRIYLAPVSWPPRENDSHAHSIMAYLDEQTRNRTDSILIVNLFSHRAIDNGLFSINSYQREKKFEFQNFVGIAPSAHNNVLDMLTRADFLIFKTGKAIDEHYGPENYTLLLQVLETLTYERSFLEKEYKKIKTIEVPFDRSSVEIYQRVDGRSESIDTFYSVLKKNIAENE